MTDVPVPFTSTFFIFVIDTVEHLCALVRTPYVAIPQKYLTSRLSFDNLLKSSPNSTASLYAIY